MDGVEGKEGKINSQGMPKLLGKRTQLVKGPQEGGKQVAFPVDEFRVRKEKNLIKRKKGQGIPS